MRVLAVVVLAMLLFGCGSDMTGTFYGNGAVTRGSNFQEQIILSVTDSGGAISGQWTTNPAGPVGTFQGTLDGDTITAFNFIINEGNQACAGTLTGTGTFDGSYTMVLNNLTGTTRCGTVSTSIQFIKAQQ